MLASIFVLLLSLISVNPARAQDIYTMSPGEVRVFPGAPKAWIENGKIVQAEPTSRGISLRALRAGNSLIRQGQTTFLIQVRDLSTVRSDFALDAALKTSLGLRLEKRGATHTVTGQLLRLSDWRKLSEHCRELDCNYRFRAKILTELQPLVQKWLTQELSRNQLGPEKISLEPHPQILINPKHPNLKRLQAWAQSYGIQINLDEEALVMAPTVQIKVFVMEVRRDWRQKLGIKWPSSLSAQISPQFSRVEDPLTASLEALESSGSARTLAQPQILARSGKEAHFFAGGEFPIRVISPRQRDVIWKKYGIQLQFKPQVDNQGRLSLFIDSDVSSLDFSKMVDGIPVVTSHSIKSQFDLEKPQLIALSGLIRNEEGHFSEGISGLKNLPLLGSLFSSQDFIDSRTELVVFVQPEIITSEANLWN
jgi:pilus assembly protein CpaC